jgi:hypothetical protein
MARLTTVTYASPSPHEAISSPEPFWTSLNATVERQNAQGELERDGVSADRPTDKDASIALGKDHVAWTPSEAPGARMPARHRTANVCRLERSS